MMGMDYVGDAQGECLHTSIANLALSCWSSPGVLPRFGGHRTWSLHIPVEACKGKRISGRGRVVHTASR